MFPEETVLYNLSCRRAISWADGVIMASRIIALLFTFQSAVTSEVPIVDLGYAVYQGSVQEVRRKTIDKVTTLK
jgi:hypothetical protein